MDPIDCACVIHGDKYEWLYVERLYSMLQRNFSCPVRFHVWTESDRTVPSEMIHHPLKDWPGANGHRRGWWYKMQMFDPQAGPKRIFYFDLDVVIVNNLDWMLGLSPQHFWTIRDFRYLWNPQKYNINSSVMIWDTAEFSWIWQDFVSTGESKVMSSHPGDQDYLTKIVPRDRIGFLSSDRVRSWRWQVFDGGYDHQLREHRRPGMGAYITEQDCVIVFHGDPKPSQIDSPQILEHWC